MLKDMDFGFYGKGIDGYVHYSLAINRIREAEEQKRKEVMDDLDRALMDCDADLNDTGDFDSDDFGCDDF